MVTAGNQIVIAAKVLWTRPKCPPVFIPHTFLRERLFRCSALNKNGTDLSCAEDDIAFVVFSKKTIFMLQRGRRDRSSCEDIRWRNPPPPKLANAQRIVPLRQPPTLLVHA